MIPDLSPIQPPAIVRLVPLATFGPGKPSILCQIFPKFCNPKPPVKPPEEVPIPGPLPVLGVFTAFAASRKLRQRIKRAGQ